MNPVEPNQLEAARPLPWQQTQWQGLMDRLRAGRMPHALLFTGPPGTGKAQFAASLAQAMLCKAPHADGYACQTCRACLLFAAGSHPDLLRVVPAEEGKVISIDQVRELNAYFGLKSHYGGPKCALIAPAERMNRAAANGLLKTLEEPTPQALLVLVTHKPALLPATVRSRCQIVHFPQPAHALALDWLSTHTGAARDEVRQWLELADGAPLSALRMAQDGSLAQRAQVREELARLAYGQLDPLAVAAAWAQEEGGGVAQRLQWMLGAVMDMIKYASVPRPAPVDTTDDLRRCAEHVGTRALYTQLDGIVEALRTLTHPVNVPLLLEAVLIAWSRACASVCMKK